MSWSPNLNLSDDLNNTFDNYEAECDYGLSRSSLRPGKAPLDVVECDDESDDSLDAMAYRRNLGVAKKTEKKRWPDATSEDDSSVELEIYKMIRDTGSVREPRQNPLNSKTTSKTATPLDKYPVAGVKGLFLTADHFKFENVYFRSPKKDEKAVDDNGNCSAGTGYGSCSDETANTDTAERQQFIQPNMDVAGEKYVSPAELYSMKVKNVIDIPMSHALGTNDPMQIGVSQSTLIATNLQPSLGTYQSQIIRAIPSTLPNLYRQPTTGTKRSKVIRR